MIDPRGGYGAHLEVEDAGFVDVPIPSQPSGPIFRDIPLGCNSIYVAMLGVVAFWRRHWYISVDAEVWASTQSYLQRLPDAAYISLEHPHGTIKFYFHLRICF